MCACGKSIQDGFQHAHINVNQRPGLSECEITCTGLKAGGILKLRASTTGIVIMECAGLYNMYNPKDTEVLEDVEKMMGRMESKNQQLPVELLPETA